jgi:hypothetical protein
MRKAHSKTTDWKEAADDDDDDDDGDADDGFGYHQNSEFLESTEEMPS